MVISSPSLLLERVLKQKASPQCTSQDPLTGQTRGVLGDCSSLSAVGHKSVLIPLTAAASKSSFRALTTKQGRSSYELSNQPQLLSLSRQRGRGAGRRPSSTSPITWPSNQ